MTGTRRATALVAIGAAAVAVASGIAVGGDLSLGEKAAACILFAHDPGARTPAAPRLGLGLGEPAVYSARTTSDRTIALVAVGRASVAWNSTGGDPEALEASILAEQLERNVAEQALADCPGAP